MQDKVRQLFTESIQTQIAAGDTLAGVLEQSALMIVQTLLTGNKVICCGYQSCFTLSTHFANLLINHFETERPCLPAITLNSDLNSMSTVARDVNHAEHFSRQVRALANPGDLLLAFSLTGNEAPVVAAIESALTKDLAIIAFNGEEGHDISGLLGNNDIEVKVPSKRPARIMEGHLFHIHLLAELIDETLFPQQEA
ncbi:SIS domain-containing protein [Flocculibacter collagenilyticus]|uniref:SIS domain-containing protein n=1 Tax=Flocculibacter collagenilyticus TaxID=2744479 RepID=UPI0018F72115|nr:SIS domain-containing protein [Flocculibacter collagenilyticus]